LSVCASGLSDRVHPLMLKPKNLSEVGCSRVLKFDEVWAGETLFIEGADDISGKRPFLFNWTIGFFRQLEIGVNGKRGSLRP